MTVGRVVSIVAAAIVLTMAVRKAAAEQVPPRPSSVGSAEVEQKRYDGRTIEQWRDVIKSLELSSPEAAEAVPGLIAICRDPAAPQQTRLQAAYTLGRIGAPAKSAVPVLEKLLRPPEKPNDPPTARWAAKALAQFGPIAAEATPSLVTLATEGERPVLERQAAIEALGRIGGAHPKTIPALIQLTSSSEPATGSEFETQQIRAAAIDCVAMAGPAAGAAVPSLIRLTRDASPDLRERAAAALGAIGPAAGIASGALVDLVLFDETPMVQDAAVTSLAQIGEPGEGALRHLLSDEDAAVRRLAVSSLGSIERLTDTSRKALVAALDDADIDVRLSAVESLRLANHDPALLLPVLLSALTDEERQSRIRAYRILIGMRNHAEALLPRLRELADDPRPHVQQVTEKAIEELTQPETGC